MPTFKKLFVFLGFFLVFLSSLFGETNFFSPLPPESLTEDLLSQMDDEEILGQVLMIGYTGTSPSKEVLEWIEDKHIGGIKIFGWNVDSLAELAEGVGTMQKTALQSSRKIPLLIATDQEGGWVRHVKAETSLGVGNMALGATGLPYDAYYTGYYIGQELHALGINMNFAPTVDVYSNPEAHVIGPRAFSDDPVKTAELALAYYQGLRASGIIATAKHFPGHGDAKVDSHGDMPRINKSFTELWDHDLVPFRHLIHEHVPAVMCGHLSFPEITNTPLPATLSPFFQTELLRNKLGYNGISITDDLLMNGVTQTGLAIDEIAERAISAGNDIILISRNPEIHRQIWERLIRLMKTNPRFKSRVYEAARRVIRTKCTYLKGASAVPLEPDVKTISEKVPNREGKAFFYDLACRSVSVVKNGSIPLHRIEPEKVLLVGQFNRFIAEGKARYPGADGYYFPYDPFYQAETEHIEELQSILPRYETLIFCLANPNSAQVLRGLYETIKSNDITCIAFSVLSPTYLYELPWVDSAIAVYGFGEESFQAGFAVLHGDFASEGTFPINFEAFYTR